LLDELGLDTSLPRRWEATQGTEEPIPPYQRQTAFVPYHDSVRGLRPSALNSWISNFGGLGGGEAEIQDACETAFEYWDSISDGLVTLREGQREDILRIYSKYVHLVQSERAQCIATLKALARPSLELTALFNPPAYGMEERDAMPTEAQMVELCAGLDAKIPPIAKELSNLRHDLGACLYPSQRALILIRESHSVDLLFRDQGTGNRLMTTAQSYGLGAHQSVWAAVPGSFPLNSINQPDISPEWWDQTHDRLQTAGVDANLLEKIQQEIQDHSLSRELSAQSIEALVERLEVEVSGGSSESVLESILGDIAVSTGECIDKEIRLVKMVQEAFHAAPGATVQEQALDRLALLSCGGSSLDPVGGGVVLSHQQYTTLACHYKELKKVFKSSQSLLQAEMTTLRKALLEEDAREEVVLSLVGHLEHERRKAEGELDLCRGDMASCLRPTQLCRLLVTTARQCGEGELIRQCLALGLSPGVSGPHLLPSPWLPGPETASGAGMFRWWISKCCRELCLSTESSTAVWSLCEAHMLASSEEEYAAKDLLSMMAVAMEQGSSSPDEELGGGEEMLPRLLLELSDIASFSREREAEFARSLKKTIGGLAYAEAYGLVNMTAAAAESNHATREEALAPPHATGFDSISAAQRKKLQKEWGHLADSRAGAIDSIGNLQQEMAQLLELGLGEDPLLERCLTSLLSQCHHLEAVWERGIKITTQVLSIPQMASALLGEVSRLDAAGGVSGLVGKGSLGIAGGLTVEGMVASPWGSIGEGLDGRERECRMHAMCVAAGLTEDEASGMQGLMGDVSSEEASSIEAMRGLVKGIQECTRIAKEEEKENEDDQAESTSLIVEEDGTLTTPEVPLELIVPYEAQFWAKMISGAGKETKAKARKLARGDGEGWEASCGERLKELKSIDSSLRATRARCMVEMRGILGTVKACRMIYLAGERKMASQPVPAEPVPALNAEGYGHLDERLGKMSSVVTTARQAMLSLTASLYHRLGAGTCEEEEARMEEAWSSLCKLETDAINHASVLWEGVTSLFSPPQHMELILNALRSKPLGRRPLLCSTLGLAPAMAVGRLIPTPWLADLHVEPQVHAWWASRCAHECGFSSEVVSAVASAVGSHAEREAKAEEELSKLLDQMQAALRTPEPNSTGLLGRVLQLCESVVGSEREVNHRIRGMLQVGQNWQALIHLVGLPAKGIAYLARPSPPALEMMSTLHERLCRLYCEEKAKMSRLARDIGAIIEQGEEEEKESTMLQTWTTLKHMPMAAKVKFDALRHEMRNVLTEAQQVRALRYAESSPSSSGEVSMRLSTLGLCPQLSMQSLWPVQWFLRGEVDTIEPHMLMIQEWSDRLGLSTEAVEGVRSSIQGHREARGAYAREGHMAMRRLREGFRLRRAGVRNLIAEVLDLYPKECNEESALLDQLHHRLTINECGESLKLRPPLTPEEEAAEAERIEKEAAEARREAEIEMWSTMWTGARQEIQDQGIPHPN